MLVSNRRFRSESAVNWRCFFGHDWHSVRLNVVKNSGRTDRVCLRCKLHEVPISVGGGWGGWQEIGDWEASMEASRARRDAAKAIAAERASDKATAD